MLDFSKISFNEIDKDVTIEFFFDYDLTREEIIKFLQDYTEIDERDVVGIELCLIKYPKTDWWKLEAILTYLDKNHEREQEWIHLSDYKGLPNDFRQLILRECGPEKFYQMILGDIDDSGSHSEESSVENCCKNCAFHGDEYAFMDGFTCEATGYNRHAEKYGCEYFVAT